VTEDDSEYDTVRRWRSNVDGMFHLSSEEWATRLGVLRAFCAEARTDPDQMITRSRVSREAKNEYMRQLKRFVRDRYPDARSAHDAENVVRSFFIHNGARVFVRPYE
jgi:hypothetical protein